MPKLLLTRPPKSEGASIGAKKDRKRKLSGGEDLQKGFMHIHESCKQFGSIATPRRYMTFLHAYEHVYTNKKKGIVTRQERLQAGVSKLNEAKELVDNLKSKAAQQSLVLAEKQEEADRSLGEITVTMQVGLLNTNIYQ